MGARQGKLTLSQTSAIARKTRFSSDEVGLAYARVTLISRPLSFHLCALRTRPSQGCLTCTPVPLHSYACVCVSFDFSIFLLCDRPTILQYSSTASQSLECFSMRTPIHPNRSCATAIVYSIAAVGWGLGVRNMVHDPCPGQKMGNIAF
jgi:hypothetical protein